MMFGQGAGQRETWPDPVSDGAPLRFWMDAARVRRGNLDGAHLGSAGDRSAMVEVTIPGAGVLTFAEEPLRCFAALWFAAFPVVLRVSALDSPALQRERLLYCPDSFFHRLVAEQRGPDVSVSILSTGAQYNLAESAWQRLVRTIGA